MLYYLYKTIAKVKQMKKRTQKAFTMVELVFVIVVIGILAAIAIPKLAVTRDDAIITKAQTTVASVRSAISTERQKRILRGDFTAISSVDSGQANGSDKPIFDHFDGSTTTSEVLEFPLRTCKSGETSGCWLRTAPSRYTYYMPHNSDTVVFDSNGSRFECVTYDDNCKLLTQ